jgi:diguanylate cyclase (GGDEF)-like protein
MTPGRTGGNGGTEILIAEDSTTQAEHLQSLLVRNGYAVTAAANGREALAAVRARRPTLVISDIVMPEMDGYTLCSTIKADDVLKDVPVILVTALSCPQDIFKGLECGADNFVAKPYGEQHLLSLVSYILANRELRKGRKMRMGVDIVFGGEQYFITSERQQILDLLLSSYETAVRKNLDLVKAQEELQTLNARLEQRVQERTTKLTAEIVERRYAEERLNVSLAEKEALVRKLHDLAAHDGLTGLYNHRMLHELLDEEQTRAQRFNRPVSLLMLDIDHFKRVNDTYGHPAGDAVLRGLSEMLCRQARAIDHVCRYGGEEISVILPETGLETAATIAERVCAAVAAQPFDVDMDTPVRITVSIGVASWPAQADSTQVLIAAADTAMYAAKQRGGNRVIRHEPARGRPPAGR